MPESVRVVLVGVEFSSRAHARPFDPQLEELALLAESAGDRPVARLCAHRQSPDPALFIGSGKADELKALVAAHEAVGVIFDQALSPVQQRNLERHLGVEVIDRTMLILEIFAARARSFEGKLQVELAKLQYLATRLVRRWSHLERQRGGVGHRGGPGERQIELDRRMIDQRIKALKTRLQRVKRQRQTQQRSRQRHAGLRVSLVGYTNAGKSTLFNALTKAEVYAADQLFATLDTTTRQLYLPELQASVTLSDTVGFVRDLPHALVEAFAATLQETVDADLLLHVVDASSEHATEQIGQVLGVLRDIGADTVPQLLVFNKVDALAPQQQPVGAADVFEVAPGHVLTRVFVSARTGVGLEQLRARIAEFARAGMHDETADEPDSGDNRLMAPRAGQADGDRSARGDERLIDSVL